MKSSDGQKRRLALQLGAARLAARRLSSRAVHGAVLSAGVVAALAVGAGPLAAPAFAQVVSVGDHRSGAVMVVAVNKSQVLRLDRAFSRAMIGNPEIADVMPLTLNSVYVLGRAAGTTNLALYDRRGELIAVVDVVVGPDVQGLKRQIS